MRDIGTVLHYQVMDECMVASCPDRVLHTNAFGVVGPTTEAQALEVA